MNKESHHHSRGWFRAALSTVILAGSVYFLRFGYGFGVSDQDELIPLAMKFLDPTAFQNDWFVAYQASEFGVRTIPAHLLAFFAKIAPMETVVLILHMLTWVALCGALFSIAERMWANRAVSAFFVLLVAVISARWNPGGNDLIHAVLVPSSISWALSLWGYDRILGKMPFQAGILTGLAILIQPLVGLQVGAVFLVLLFVQQRSKAWMFAVPFLLAALPISLALSGLSSDSSSAVDASFILTQVRSPHHYYPEYFSLAHSVRWFAMLPIGLGMLFYYRKSHDAVHMGLQVLIIVLGVLATSYLVINVFDWQLLVRLQPFKLSVFARLIALSGCVLLLTQFPAPKIWTKVSSAISSTRFLAASFVLLAISLLSPQFSPYLSERTQLVDSSLMEAFKWIEENTPEDAVFAIPPSLTGFQIHTSRAQYVNFKAYPFDSSQSTEWLRRLRTIAPVSEVLPGGVPLLRNFESSYTAQSPARMGSVLLEEGIDFVFRPFPSEETNKQSDWNTKSATWCNSTWCVFETAQILSEEPHID